MRNCLTNLRLKNRLMFRLLDPYLPPDCSAGELSDGVFATVSVAVVTSGVEPLNDGSRASGVSALEVAVNDSVPRELVSDDVVAATRSLS